MLVVMLYLSGSSLKQEWSHCRASSKIGKMGHTDTILSEIKITVSYDVFVSNIVCVLCGVGFKHLLYSAIVSPQRYTSLRHACIIILYKNIIERVVVYVNI